MCNFAIKKRKEVLFLMELNLILPFLGASIMLTLMPGPDTLYVLSESITKGARNGIAVATGLVSGVFLHTAAAALGLSIVLKQSELAFSIIKYAGAAYLLYLAWLSYQEQPPEIGALEKGINRTPFLKLFKTGFIMNILNPKVSLFFIAFLPQFVSPGSMAIEVQMIFLGLLFIVQALIIFILLSLLSGWFSSYLQSPEFWKATKYSKVILLTVLGLSLAFATQ